MDKNEGTPEKGQEYVNISLANLICLTQHAVSLFEQSNKEQITDIGEPCALCKQYRCNGGTCDVDWISHFAPILEITGIRMQMGSKRS